MDQKSLKQIGLVAGCFIIGAILYFLSENILIAVIGAIGAGIFYESGEWLFAYCRINSHGFFANVGKKGHSSIIADDKLRLYSPYDTGVVYTCFRPGGSDLWWAPFHGMGDIYIAKEDLVEEEDGSTIVKGDWSIVNNFSELPLEWQKRILYKFRQDRTVPFNPKRHKVFYTENYTPQINDYDKEKKEMNVSGQERFLKQESIINTYKNQIEELQTIMSSEMSLLKKYKAIDQGEDNQPKYRLVKEE